MSAPACGSTVVRNDGVPVGTADGLGVHAERGMIALPGPTRRDLVVALVLAAIAASACGGGHKSPDQEMITRTVHSYLRAQIAGGQRQLIALVVKGARGLVTTRPSCEDAVGLVRAVAGAQLLGALVNAEIEHVHVSGSRATADVVDGLQFPPHQVRLEKVGTSWKIAGVPGLHQ